MERNSAKVYQFFGMQNAVACKFFWTDLMVACGLETDFTTVGIMLGKIGGSVNAERMNNNPVKFSQQELLEILSAA